MGEYGGVKSLGEPSEKWFILSRITERINYRKSGCIGGIIISRISLMDPQILIRKPNDIFLSQNVGSKTLPYFSTASRKFAVIFDLGLC